MKQEHSIKYALLTRYLLVFALIIYVSVSCNNKENKLTILISKIDSPQVSWNILFKPGTDSLARNTAINNIISSVEKYYRNYIKKNRKDYVLLLNPIVWCPCDSLLYNISFSVINGSGGSVIVPPPGKKIAGSGDLVANVSDNIPITEPNKSNIYEHSKKRKIVPNLYLDSSKILAIIDSGIDTTLFTGEIKNLIWSDQFAATIYNFLPFQPIHDFSDQTREKHGSAVTSIALNAIEKASLYPKIMILKALNEKNEGSIFSVSCALSYAIQKKANVVNLSLGYYGVADSILYHYLELCNSAKPVIEVFAAAGNTPGTHNPSDLCNANSLKHNNILATGQNMFYPACFTTEFNNMISVTQLSQPNKPCYYQNYSNQLVSLGIIDTTNCCATQVSFNLFEGSSFATPVASGLRMMTILKGRNAATANSIWNSLIDFAPEENVTIKGKYIRYVP